MNTYESHVGLRPNVINVLIGQGGEVLRVEVQSKVSADPPLLFRKDMI